MTLLTPASTSRGSGIRDGPGWQMGVCSMPKVIKLTSSPLVHTPGIFRWLQHQFATGEKTAATNVLVQGYKLSRQVASGLLSGKIPVTIDDEAETVTFTVA